MKALLRKTLLNSLSLWLTSLFLVGFKFGEEIVTLLLAGFVLLLIQKIIKPILQILTLPFNLLTFGLFSWLINVATLYLLTFFVPQIRITAFTFQGANLAGFVIPRMELNLVGAFIATAFVLTLIQKFLDWVTS